VLTEEDQFLPIHPREDEEIFGSLTRRVKWCISLIPALGLLMQEDHELEVSLVNIVSSKKPSFKKINKWEKTKEV
jgi:hypothetical protein